MPPSLANVHPELQPIIKRMPAVSFSARYLWLWRLLMNMPSLARPPADMHIENRFIPGPDPGTKIRVRLYRPKALTPLAPALVWLHGGGYIIGKPEQDDVICIQYARALGLLVVAVDYRCAPEHPFPAPLEDCYAALKWVAGQAGALGVDAKRLAIGGASAGAGLAAALAQLAHDRKEVAPVFQLLVYPMLDDRTVTDPALQSQDYFIWNQASNRFGWEAYLGQACGAATALAYAVPARRADVSGLPPAWMGVGSLDLFHNEDVAYAQRLQAAGVPCEVVVVPGAFHGFDVAGTHLPVIQAFRQSQLAALRRYLLPG